MPDRSLIMGLGTGFGILDGVMRALLALLIVACAGLLWATVAAARHIRRSRRRRRGITPAPPPPPQAQVIQPAAAINLPEPRARERTVRAKQLQTHF